MESQTLEQYVDWLKELRRQREIRKSEIKAQKPKRANLTRTERDQVANKTGSRCHICGGVLEARWHADHVMSHSSGGRHEVDNYLPAHATCNNYRWDYSPAEFAEILKLGVFLRSAIEKGDQFAARLAKAYLTKERSRLRRVTGRR